MRCCFPKCVCVCVHLLFGTASGVTVNTHHKEGESSKERVPRTKTLEKYALFGSAPSRGPNGMRAKKRRQGGSKSTGEAPSRDRPASLTATAACGCVCVCVCVCIKKERGLVREPLSLARTLCTAPTAAALCAATRQTGKKKKQKKLPSTLRVAITSGHPRLATSAQC